MMNTMKWLTLLIVALLALSLGACSSETPAPTDDTTTTTRATVPTVPRIEKDISRLFTAEELTDIVGVPMQAPAVSGQGATLTSYAVDSMISRVIVDIQEQNLDVFLQSVSMWYPDLIEARNLGESAWFSPSFNHLIVYNNGFMFTIDYVIEGQDNSDVNLLTCREIALLILERY